MTTQHERQITSDIDTAYQTHESGLHRHSLYRVHNEEMSTDMVQDTFARTWVCLKRGGTIATMKAFLYHTLNCLIIDEYRKRRPVSLEPMIARGFEPGYSDTEQLIDKLDGKRVLLLIQQLPETYGRVLRMRYIQGLSLQEMTDATGIRRSTLAVQIHRGLRRLRALYEHDT